MNDRPPDEPPASRLGEPQPRATRRQRLRDLAIGAVLALGFALLAIFVLPTRNDEDVVRGDELGRLQVQVTREGDTRPLQPADLLRSGDALSFTYRGTEAGHLTVLGVDVDGRVRVLYPAGEHAAAWSPQEPVVDASAVLGREPPPVVFAGVLCPGPVPVSEVRRALEATASTPERFALLTCQIDLLRTGARTGARMEPTPG